MQDADTDAAPNDGLTEAMAMIPAEPAQAEVGGDKTEGEGGQPRDEHGRFTKAEAEAAAAKVEADKAAKGNDGEDREGGQIPSWRLREIREERDRIAAAHEADRRRLEALERERAQWLQRQRQEREAAEAPQRPDPITDPEGYDAWINQTLDSRTAAIEEQFRNQWVNLTFAEEHEKHGETFEKALKALEDARSPQTVAEIREAVNPGKALMRWYRRQATMQEVGDDLEGYHKKLWDQWKSDPERRKEFMAALEAEARGSNGAGRSENNVTSLPSVNRASGSAGNQRPGSLGSTDAEIYASLSAKR